MMGSISPAADGPCKYVLRQTLSHHTSDVKYVRSAPSEGGNDLLITASRDCTGVLSRRPKTAAGRAAYRPERTYTGSSRYINACAYLPASPRNPSQVILGSLDSQVYVYDEGRGDKAVQIINDHFDNVCALDVFVPPDSQPLLASASWDCTARIFYLGFDRESGESDEQREERATDTAQFRWRKRYLLKGHESAVWSVKVVEEDQFLTASADRLIRLFKKEQCVARFEGHTDVVRSLAILPSKPSRSDSNSSELYHGSTLVCAEASSRVFASASNDGTLRLWDLDGGPLSGAHNEDATVDSSLPTVRQATRVFKGHESFVYEVTALNERSLVSCSEDGSSRVWDVNEGTLLQTIWHNATSIWTLCVLPHSMEIVTGSSDAKVRIFSIGEAAAAEQDEEIAEARYAFERAGEEMRVRIEGSSSIGTDGQVVISQVVVSDSNPPAVTASSAIEAPAHEPLDTATADAGAPVVLQIDVADDREPLSLRVNKTDDPSAVAKALVAEHGLPESYVEKIKDFVQMMIQ
ncbi:WD40 repeat-like protein [Tilletiaria anomala UBC 951]|uniref:WD40 repeat-like protein n=1 Tax=Tilletiaria anomala (strain ATCC 24038 / CBS 436.72 / UBC 951) TaxID=1037660 RepID=A0A066WAI8_TILAU|nr:WD40 repeat-like protein [Tilletiaria anomala UBC 951]KDN49568.1 WD40 repeat-like protein [Tilletiaria anomala UBC 951]